MKRADLTRVAALTGMKPDSLIEFISRPRTRGYVV